MSGNTGRLVLGVAGAIVGNIIAPGVGASYGWALGSAVGALAFPPTSPDIEGPRLNDLRVQQSQYGSPIPIIFGTYRTAGTVLWKADLIEDSTEEEIGGGKGAPSQKQTTYSYYADFAVLLADCKDSPIIGIRRIWDSMTGELIYDVGDDATLTSQAASTQIAESITVYTGTSTQNADPTIESYLGVGNAPGYRYRAYVVFKRLALQNFSNRIPNLEFEIVASGSTTGLRHVTSLSSAFSFSGTSVHPTYVRVQDGVITFNLHELNTQYRFDYTLSAFPQQPAPTEERTKHLFGFLGTEAVTVNTTDYAGQHVLIIGGTPIASREWNRATQEDGDFLGACVSANGQRLYVLRVANGNTDVELTVYDAALTQLGQATVTGVVPLLQINGNGVVMLPGLGSSSGLAVESDQAHWWMRRGGSSTVELCTVEDDGTLTLDDTVTSSLSGFGSNIWAGADDGIMVTVGCTPTGSPTSNNRISIVSRNPVLTDSNATLSDIVTTLCERTNSDDDLALTASDLDVTALTDSVKGYMFSRQAPIRTALEQLGQAFFSEAVESDGKLKFVKRGGASAATISVDDLAAHDYGSETPDPLTVVRQQEVEIPSSVTVSYPDYTNSFQVATQSSRRVNLKSGSPLSVQLPVALTATQGRAVADTLRFDALKARDNYRFSTTRKYAHLEPTDVVTVDGKVLRLLQKSETPAGLISWVAAAEDSRAYTKVFPSATWARPSDSLSLVGPTKLVVMDLPALRDIDDFPGVYVAARGYLSGWQGAAIYRSDDSVSYSEVATITTAAVIGYATTALGDHVSGNVFDEKNTVTVRLIGGSLSSATRTQVLNGHNAAALYSTDGWEVLQYRTATDNGDGTWTLSGLLRGRKGTEFAMDAHAVNDTFVSLSSGVQRVNHDVDDVNGVRHWKAVSFGQVVNDVASQEHTDSGASIKPLSPVLLGGGRNEALDVTINWERRTRIGGEWRDFVDVPVSEVSEEYEVEIYDNTYATLKRTISSITSSNTTYTAAQQITDFGSEQATVYFKVYQISDSAGRGYAATGQV